MKNALFIAMAVCLAGCGTVSPVGAVVLGGLAAGGIAAASQAHTENEQSKQLETIMTNRGW